MICYSPRLAFIGANMGFGKGGRGGRGGRGAAENKSSGSDRAPSFRGAYVQTNQTKEKPKFEGVPALSENMIKSKNWLRAYPDTKKNFCSIVDFGKGPKVFHPNDLSKHLDTNRSEFKRHVEKGVSMTAASLRAMHSVVSQMSDEVGVGNGAYLKTLVEMKKFFESADGKRLLPQLKILDMGNEGADRSEQSLRKAIVVFLQTIATHNDLVRLITVIASESAKLFLGAVWTAEAKACVYSMDAWANGFPSDTALLGKFPLSVRKWLRDPQSKPLLLDMIVSGYMGRSADKEQHDKRGRNDWGNPEEDEYIEAEDDELAEDDEVEDEDEADAGGSTGADDWSFGFDLNGVAQLARKKRNEDSWGDVNPSQKPPKRKVAQVAGRDPWAAADFMQSPKKRKTAPTAARSNAFALGLSDEEQNPEDEDPDKAAAEAYTQWELGAVQLLAAAIESAKSNLGDKKLSMKREDFLKELKQVPDGVMTLHGLGDVVKTLEKMTKMPKSEKLIGLFDKVLDMTNAVAKFFKTGIVPYSGATGSGIVDAACDLLPSQQVKDD